MTMAPGTRAEETAECALALGTVQLGQPYGIANRTGQPDEAAARAILDRAVGLGVRYFDTAQAYGRSEDILGRYLAADAGDVAAKLRVVTKLLPSPRGGEGGPGRSNALRSKALRPNAPRSKALERAEIEGSLQGSWERLGRRPIWGMLLHRETMLDDWDGCLGETLRAWRQRGRIARLGVSVHTPEGMRRAIETPDVEIVQLPASAFDRRMLRAGLLARAEAEGKKLFVRSVFLQGLMLMEPEDAARKLPSAVPSLERLRAFCARRGVDRRRFALGYVRHHAPNALLVIGSETVDQVAENCRLMLEVREDDPQLYAEWDAACPEDDPALVDPSTWAFAEAR